MEIVKYLLQQGADRHLRNKQDKVGWMCQGALNRKGMLAFRVTQSTSLRQVPMDLCELHHNASPPLHPPGQVPMDLCEPCWSNAYRFTREVLAEY